MGRRITAYALLFALILSFGSMGLAYSSKTSDKLDDVQKNIDKTEDKLNQGKKEENKLLKEVKSLEGKIVATQGEIDALRGSIDLTQAKIDTAVADLAALEESLTVQNDNLNARLRAMYMNGNVGFLDVLLGSDSISDLMTNMDRVQLIYESDREVVAELKQQQDVVNAQKEYLMTLQADLVKERDAEAAKKEALKQDQTAVATKKAEVAKNNDALEATLDALNAEADRLIRDIIALQGTGTFEEGYLKWPVPGVTKITSEFGYRMHPILKYKKLHTGMDIGAPSGSKVVAAASGKVIMAGWNNSYGNVVMIDHGSKLVTVYAHNSSLSVNKGDAVIRGDEIARSGNTGMSTGPHVHFEVRVNGEYVDPRQYLK